MNPFCRRRIGWSRRLVLGLVLWVAVNPAAPVAADEMRYSLGTVQAERELLLSAAGSAATTLWFYNIDGNVPVKVELSVPEAPAGWEVTLEHAGASRSRGSTVSLAVAPSLPSSMPSVSVESGRETVWIEPRGYVCVEEVRVHLRAPATAAPGVQCVVRIGAVAAWKVPGLGVPLLQEREFVYWVHLNDENATGTQMVDEAGARVRVPLLLAGVVCLLGAACLRGRVV